MISLKLKLLPENNAGKFYSTVIFKETAFITAYTGGILTFTV